LGREEIRDKIKEKDKRRRVPSLTEFFSLFSSLLILNL